MAEQKVIMTDPRQEDYFYQEAIKTLRTNIQFAGMDVKTILFTSCYPNEGKSDITFQLSQEIGKIREKGTSSRRRYPQVDTRIPVRSGKTGSGIIKLLERSGFYRGDYLSYEL